jgi:hypothetical protein
MRYIIVIIYSFFLLSAYGQNTTSVKQHLRGKWISEDDKQFELVFKDSIKQDFYYGKVESTYQYWIKKDTLIAKDVSSGDVFNYAIMGITGKHLTLMYLEKGNLLKFRKQSAAKIGEAKKRLKKQIEQ